MSRHHSLPPSFSFPKRDDDYAPSFVSDDLLMTKLDLSAHYEKLSATPVRYAVAEHGVYSLRTVASVALLKQMLEGSTVYCCHEAPKRHVYAPLHVFALPSAVAVPL